MGKSFGAFIRYRRQRLGLTQRQLADQLGLRSAAFLSDIESGNRKPSISLFPALARVLETDVRDLQACDARYLLSEIRELLESRPDSAPTVGRIVEAIRELGADEALHRIENYAPPASEGKTRKAGLTRSRRTPAPADTLDL